MTKRPAPYCLTQHHISHDTIEAMELALDEAKRGRIIGVAMVVMFKRREFATCATGEALRNPTFSRGMVAHLDDYLRDVTPEKEQK